MQTETVRLTVQLRDENNKIRLTTHADVEVDAIAERAKDIADRMGSFYKKEKTALKYGNKKAKGQASGA